MHLEGPWLSTTGKKKGKQKWASAEHKQKAEQAEADWKALQKKWGVEAEDKRRSRALAAAPYVSPPKTWRGSDAPKLPSRDTGGNAVLRPSPVYTGTKVKGIATMHKSNAVPVFSDEEAVAISGMRR